MELTVTTALVGGIFPLLLLLLLWRSFWLSPRLPPGPRPLPIVGNLLLLKKHGSLQDFANELKRQYGPIVTFWMGSKPIVIISGPEIIQEAMITQGGLFTARAQPQSTSIMQDGHRILSSGDGTRYRFIRKLMATLVTNNKRVAEFRPIRDTELGILVDSLKRQLHGNGGKVSNFRPLVRLAVCNLIMAVLLGRRLTLEEYEELAEQMVERFNSVGGKPRDFMPWLAWLPDREGVEAALKSRKRLSQSVGPLIEERKQVLKSGVPVEPTFVDTLLALREGELPGPIEILDSDIELITVDILNAGTDTTEVTLEFCIANLVNQPEMQERVAREISAAVGERVVNEDDIPQMPYLQAVVKESLRRHSPARLAPTRRAAITTKVAGYDIPVNTTVLQHLEGVALSPQIWEDPLEFRPERFLNKTVDLTGSTEITMIPFGVGRRNCPAVNIAFLHTELILARLVQAFRWNPLTPGQRLDLSRGIGLTSPMKYPLAASVVGRVMVS